MKHTRRLTVAKAVTKDFDESLFFSLYFSVLTFMMTAAFSDK